MKEQGIRKQLEIFKTANPQIEIDEFGTELLVTAILDKEFEENMVNDDNPRYKEILRQFRVSLRKRKIDIIQSL